MALRHIQHLIVTLGIVLLGHALAAQPGVQEDNQAYLNRITEALKPSTEQAAQWKRIVAEYSMTLSIINDKKEKLQTMNLTDEQWMKEDTQLTTWRKEAKEKRDLELQATLTPEQTNIYQTQVAPPKPAVLHMGINHDRAKCTVCVKP